jgi:hypothetical protein
MVEIIGRIGQLRTDAFHDGPEGRSTTNQIPDCRSGGIETVVRTGIEMEKDPAFVLRQCAEDGPFAVAYDLIVIHLFLHSTRRELLRITGTLMQAQNIGLSVGRLG